jgi:hypothetical protein
MELGAVVIHIKLQKSQFLKIHFHFVKMFMKTYGKKWIQK